MRSIIVLALLTGACASGPAADFARLEPACAQRFELEGLERLRQLDDGCIEALAEAGLLQPTGPGFASVASSTFADGFARAGEQDGGQPGLGGDTPGDGPTGGAPSDGPGGGAPGGDAPGVDDGGDGGAPPGVIDV